MKRLLSSLVLTSCLFTAQSLPRSPFQSQTAQAQTQDAAAELYYTFYGQRIPLQLRQDAIAVAFRSSGSRRSPLTLPPALQLQQDLQRGTTSARSGSRSIVAPAPSPESGLTVVVNPLGAQYALVTLPAATPTATVAQRIQQQSYVQETLPVLTLPGSSDAVGGTLVLLNEILLSLEPGLSRAQVQLLLNRHNLELIRPLRFTQNRYLVRSRTAQGVEVLQVANRLGSAAGIQSATPNFVQSLGPQGQAADADVVRRSLAQQLAALPRPDSPLQSDLLPLSWHLNSTPQRGRLQPRTDIRATEAWQQSTGGEGVVVAVLDSLIQWDHPNLQPSLHTVEMEGDRLPNEVHGWDFAGYAPCTPDQPSTCGLGDADTRISAAELGLLGPNFRSTFSLSDAELKQQHSTWAEEIEANQPELSTRQVADVLRQRIRMITAAEFHGTWAAGVIAAQPQQQQGAIGVAPNAKILPVRVFGLYGEINTARLVEAVGYAASRNVDVINLSLGGLMPDQALADQLFQVMDAHPQLVIVASAGNDGLDGAVFPAAVPGVLSVGATNLDGRRTAYSSYGGRVDLVAPGGETHVNLGGGILTTGGTWVDGFWQGLTPPSAGWSVALDPVGAFVQVEGTSFAAPAVAGVVALMQGVNPNLTRDRIATLLQQTASYESLTLSEGDRNRYRLQAGVGLTVMQDRLSGVFPLPRPVSPEQYFFGSGLVNAEAAVRAAVPQ